MSTTDPPTDSPPGFATRAVDLIVARVGRAADEMEALLRDKGLPSDDLLNGALDSLNRASTALTVASRNAEVAHDRMEDQNRQTQAAIDSLGGDASDFQPANLPSYLHIIARHVHQMQQQMTRLEANQNTLTHRMTGGGEKGQGLNVIDAYGRILGDLAAHVDEAETRYNDIIQYMREAEARQNAILDHLASIAAKQVDSDRRMDTAVLEAMDKILDALPMIKSLKIPKRRVRSDGDEPRDASMSHGRKISFSGSLGSAKTLAHGVGGFFKKGRHNRKASMNDTSARNSTQLKRDSLLPPIRHSPLPPSA